LFALCARDNDGMAKVTQLSQCFGWSIPGVEDKDIIHLYISMDDLASMQR
jgi:hypothetical protein